MALQEPCDDARVLKGYVDSDARVDRLRRANRHKALQSELAQERAEEEFQRNQQRRAMAHAREAAITEELKRQEAERIRKEKLSQLMRERAPELRDLEAKLHAAKTAKERKNQMAEAKLIKETEQQEEKVWGDRMYNDAKNYELREFEKKLESQTKLREQMDVQKQQMEERKAVLQEAREQYIKEKSEVDAVVAKIQEEDFLEVLTKVEKQRATKIEHEVFVAQRDELKREEKERHRQEELAIKEYMEEQNKRKESGERLKREKEAIKAKILEEQSRKIASELAKKEELESLINDFYEEQRAAKQHQELEAERERRQREKEMMLAANAEQMRLKQLVKEKEMAEEQKFRQVMMEKFAQDDRIDQLNRQKRLQLKQEHARKVQELIEDKRRLREEDLEREKFIDQQAKVAEEERKALVAEERERLLREHADILQEFLPRGVAANEQELAAIRNASKKQSPKGQ
jgi:hypothetical protein